jgi:hypothetical protein
MKLQSRVGDYALRAVLFALVAFVGVQVIASRGQRDARERHTVLSARDSAAIAIQYRSQLTSRMTGYVVPEWLGDVHIARLQAAAAREVADHYRAATVSADSVHRVLAAGEVSYLTQMIAENDWTVARWRASDEPIRVWVQQHSTIPGFSRGLLGPTQRAFTVWNELQLGVHFTFVDDSTTADVHVSWSDVLPSRTQIGATFRMMDGRGWIVLAHVVLSTAWDIYAVQNAARHEAGHVLGLDHSPDANDIMAAATEGRQWAITDADRATARLLYALPPGPITAPHRQGGRHD